jgi:hypothetical protein
MTPLQRAPPLCRRRSARGCRSKTAGFNRRGSNKNQDIVADPNGCSLAHHSRDSNALSLQSPFGLDFADRKVFVVWIKRSGCKSKIRNRLGVRERHVLFHPLGHG